MVFLPETAVFWYKEGRTWEPGCNCLIDRIDSIENFNFSMFWSESALRDHKIQLSLSTVSEKKKFLFSTHCNLIDSLSFKVFWGCFWREVRLAKPKNNGIGTLLLEERFSGDEKEQIWWARFGKQNKEEIWDLFSEILVMCSVGWTNNPLTL